MPAPIRIMVRIDMLDTGIQEEYGFKIQTIPVVIGISAPITVNEMI